MKILKYILFSLLIAVAIPTEMQAKRMKAPKMYMFGFSASFQDSIVYMTDVQEVEGAWYDTKTKFLMGRQHYSYQLKDFLANNMQQPNRVCVVMYALTRKEAEKKFIKLRKEYTIKAKGKYDVRYLTTADFHFQPVDMSE
ncbi:hypothetical protein [Prevotella sp. tf2-5]|jgi:hypothetical protein|uniref:hypothetical protein n=1 Tax=Prevotella sp. tf2-5 TaxID=1761889 RepID=UPI0008F12380|nr:hypothetical protein [Prevotella sp. tf2-5]SFO84344.1 hypothetical protein SAMN04487852_10914 [Prevotella sp. tf2-5]